MSFILCIDTSGECGFVALGQQGRLVAVRYSLQQQEHASFLQPAIQMLLEEQSITMNDLAAVAVSNGPGSYTGLRVSLASAKGICFALQIPLLTLSTLEIMAAAMKKSIKGADEMKPYLLCPMIDARRNEVFMALYTSDLVSIIHPSAAVLEETMFDHYQQTIYFGGNGAQKWMNMTRSVSHFLTDCAPEMAASLCEMAQHRLEQSAMADLAYAEPFYCKDFYTPPKKQ